MRFRRERSCSVEIPGSVRWSSTNRRGPLTRSRTISNVHLSPTRSSARASGDHWSYGWRLGGGAGGGDGNLRCTSALDLPTVIQINRLTGSRGIPLTRRRRDEAAVQCIARAHGGSGAVLGTKEGEGDG